MSQFEEAVLKKLYKTKKIELLSTNYLQHIHFPTHDNDGSQNYYQQESQITSQSSDYDFEQDINQNSIIQIPFKQNKIYLISSFTKPLQNSLLKSIDQKKKNYNKLLKKKQENRQKFIQKINQNIPSQSNIFIKNHQPIKLHNKQNLKKNKQSVQTSDKKSIRSYTEQCKFKKIQDAKQENSNWDENSQIQFTLTSKRQNQSKKEDQYKKLKQQESVKKKITLKRKTSQNSSMKLKSSIKYQSQQKNETNSKGQMNRSTNQFLFIQQYQKDQKQIMNRLLNIIEQDHINKEIRDNSIKQSIVRDNMDGLIFSKMRQRSLGNSIRFGNNPLETQYSSVKPIVINNYIKSPTQFMDKGLIEKQMAIKLLEHNRNNKKIYNNSIVNSRIVSESRLVASKQQSNIKKQFHQSDLKQTSKINSIKKQIPPINKNKQKQILDQESANQFNRLQIQQKDEDNIDFELLYQKLKKETQKRKYQQNIFLQNQTKNPIKKYQRQIQKNQFKFSSIQATQSILPQSVNLTSKTFTSHNISQNVTQFKPNSSVQSELNDANYDFKRPSVSMQIHFDNQNVPKQNISLADAFKKKFGASRGQSVPKTTKSTNKSIDALSQLKNNQNNNQNIFNGTISKNEKQSDKVSVFNFGRKQNTSNKKTIKITKKGMNIKDKQNFNSIQTPRSQSEHYSTQRSNCTNMSKQPSKQLLDRLIYGQKATMTKKQMYELTKKNYMKLPQIQQKKKKQQKRLKQIQRLDKIKEYQKRIRSNKNSICKDTIKSLSVQEINQQ